MRETEKHRCAERTIEMQKKKKYQKHIITCGLLHDIYFRKTRCGTRILSTKKKEK